MGQYQSNVATSTGKYVSEIKFPNSNFYSRTFYNLDGTAVDKPSRETVDKFEEITKIESRCYSRDDQTASDMLKSSLSHCFSTDKLDPKKVEANIVAQNFGDEKRLGTDQDFVPSHAARIKHYLQIENSRTIAYDIITSKKNSEILQTALAPGKNNLIIERSRDYISLENLYFEAEKMIEKSGISRESLENIIVFHDSNFTPALSEKVSEEVGMKNDILNYDIIFGCPGWLQGMIQADTLMNLGFLRNATVSGVEKLKSVSDLWDRDSMLYSDAAGTTLKEALLTSAPFGTISSSSRSDTLKEAYYLRMEQAFNREFRKDNPRLFLHMDGKTLYKYALKNVPEVVKESIDKAGLDLKDIKKILIHQANERLDEDVVKRVFELYRITPTQEMIKEVMPMIISWLGNCSVGTIPLLFDMLIRGELNNHALLRGDNINFSSVGAGMNRNSVVYRVSGYEFPNVKIPKGMRMAA